MLSALGRPSAKFGKTRFSAHTNPSRPGLKELFWIGLQNRERPGSPSGQLAWGGGCDRIEHSTGARSHNLGCMQLVRKDCRGRVKLAVPTEIRHVGRADDVSNDAPLGRRLSRYDIHLGGIPELPEQLFAVVPLQTKSANVGETQPRHDGPQDLHVALIKLTLHQRAFGPVNQLRERELVVKICSNLVRHCLFRNHGSNLTTSGGPYPPDISRESRPASPDHRRLLARTVA
jgi:hypothetical protein